MPPLLQMLGGEGFDRSVGRHSLRLVKPNKTKGSGSGRTFTSKYRGVHQTFPTKRWEAQFRCAAWGCASGLHMQLRMAGDFGWHLVARDSSVLTVAKPREGIPAGALNLTTGTFTPKTCCYFLVNLPTLPSPWLQAERQAHLPGLL